jgi:hypothetical protein
MRAARAFYEMPLQVSLGVTRLRAWARRTHAFTRLRRWLALTALTLACRGAGTPASSGPVDSAAAVARAIAAFNCGGRGADSVRASRVTRDSLGFRVELELADPPGVGRMGGGGLVHVDQATGTVRGLECWQ